MKRIISFLFLCNFVLMVAGQNVITQQGVAYKYNGKKERTPLGNVAITYDADKRTTISDERNGAFTLTLEGRKMGDRIGWVTVKKREMMVFNKHAVEEWSVRKEPLMLILCNTDEFEKQKESLINIGRREAKKKYEKQKADLEAKLNASEIQRAEYEAALDRAYDELERLQNSMGDYADLFVRIDESEIDTLAQQAIEYFRHGDVDLAITLFERGNYLEELKQDNRKIQKFDRLVKTAQQAKRDAEQRKQKNIQSIEAQIKAYQAQGDIEKARVFYKDLVDELDEVKYYLDYALFCNKNELYDESISYSDKMLLMAEDSIASGKSDYYLVKSHMLEFKAMLYNKTGNLSQFLETADVLIKYADLMAESPEYLRYQNFPYEYKSRLADILLQMGFYCNELGDVEHTVDMLTKSVEVSKEIFINSPSDINAENYYINLHNAGNILWELQRDDELEMALLCAWEIGTGSSECSSFADAYMGEVPVTLAKLNIVKDKDEEAVSIQPLFRRSRI